MPSLSLSLLKTAQKVYVLVRQATYVRLEEQLEALILAGEIEMDEPMFGGHRKGKRRWGAPDKHLVFGLYQHNDKLITFPIPNRKTRTLTSLVFKHTQPGSLYYSNDWHAYAWLSVRGNHANHRERQRGTKKPRAKPILMELKDSRLVQRTGFIHTPSDTKISFPSLPGKKNSDSIIKTKIYSI